MKVSVSVCLLIGYFVATEARKLPSYIKPCSRSDPKLNECALKHGREAIPNFINGDPKYKVPVLDPLVLEKLAVDDHSNDAVGLSFVCERCKIIGLKGAILDDIRMDLDKKHFELDLTFPRLDVIGKYNVSGKILILPINGNGGVKLTMTNEKVFLKIDFDVYKKKDKEHLKITSIKMETKTTGFHIELTKLFNGDKNLGDNMNNFLNENWKDVVKTFGPAVEKVIIEIISNIFNNIAVLVPLAEIFIP